jgi:hypothetical protein
MDRISTTDIMQETPRKYTKPPYTKNYPRLDGKTMSRMMQERRAPVIADK